MSLARSFLYVPGDRPDRLLKAFASAADAVIVDLEDAVKHGSKPAARETVREIAAGRPGSAELWVRINSGDEGLVDLQALDGMTHIDGIVLAKCESTAWLDRVVDVVRHDVALSPLIETARALRDLDQVAAHPRVSRCHLGEVDLMADLGGRLPAGRGLLDAARVSLVVASAAAGIDPPVGGVHLELDDLDGLGASSATLADLGFGGRAIVHPSHCPAVNRSFTPSDAELAWAADVLARWSSTAAGALRAPDGSMIDEAVVRQARRLTGT